MKNTKKFATRNEINRLKKMAAEAANTPVIALSSDAASRGEDFASLAWKEVQEECHKIALKHGLPEIKGFYGLTQKGEFVMIK
ncbi:MAG: hypothetical protein AABY22_30460 [Nanoarchaeota archaeon]